MSKHEHPSPWLQIAALDHALSQFNPVDILETYVFTIHVHIKSVLPFIRW
jgi:hypothetical protein